MFSHPPAPQQPALRRQLCYREKLLPWNPFSVKNLALFYEFRSGSQAQTIRLLPDGCLDFLFRLEPHRASALVCGIASGPLTLDLTPGCVYFGVKPFTVKGLRRLTLPWGTLGADRLPLEELLPCEGLLEALTLAGDFTRRTEILRDFALARLADSFYQPDFIEWAELKLCQSRGRLRVEDVARYTGYTARYCHEKFKETHGISIKRHSNILRIQNAIRSLEIRPEISLSDLVFENGYFDQSHLNREFRLYTGDSPHHYQKDLLCAAGQIAETERSAQPCARRIWY